MLNIDCCQTMGPKKGGIGGATISSDGGSSSSSSSTTLDTSTITKAFQTREADLQRQWLKFYQSGCRMTFDDPDDVQKEQAAREADKKAADMAAPIVKCRNNEITGCRARVKVDCCNAMCFSCCLTAITTSDTVCQAHLQEKLDKEADERFFEEGFNELHNKRSTHKKKTNFYHYEDLFQNFGETVVVWCLRDFCRSKQ